MTLNLPVTPLPDAGVGQGDVLHLSVFAVDSAKEALIPVVTVGAAIDADAADGVALAVKVALEAIVVVADGGVVAVSDAVAVVVDGQIVGVVLDVFVQHEVLALVVRTAVHFCGQLVEVFGTGNLVGAVIGALSLLCPRGLCRGGQQRGE